jgi:hypothetical protein
LLGLLGLLGKLDKSVYTRIRGVALNLAVFPFQFFIEFDGILGVGYPSLNVRTPQILAEIDVLAAPWGLP